MTYRSFAAAAALLIGFAGSANAFETGQKSYSDPPAAANFSDPDEALQQRANMNGNIGSQQNFSSGGGYSYTYGAQGFGSPGGPDNMPQFPGMDNHLTTTDNARALQFGYTPTTPMNRW
jgi:hypothetical protein